MKTEYLQKIRQAGFEVLPTSSGFTVEPLEKLSHEQKKFLSEHKAEILAELAAEEELIWHKWRSYISMAAECQKQITKKSGYGFKRRAQR